MRDRSHCAVAKPLAAVAFGVIDIDTGLTAIRIRCIMENKPVASRIHAISWYFVASRSSNMTP